MSDVICTALRLAVDPNFKQGWDAAKRMAEERVLELETENAKLTEERDHLLAIVGKVRSVVNPE